jgi:prefoldin subunit 5
VDEWIWKSLPVVALAVQGLFVWGMWSLSKSFVTCDSCRATHAGYDAQLAEIEADGQELRGSLAKLATTEDLHQVAMQVQAVSGGQEALRESVKSLGISIDRLDKPIQLLLEHHINGGGK